MMGGGGDGGESVIGRARALYIYSYRETGESAKRHRSLMQIDNSVTRFTRVAAATPCKISKPPFVRSLARSQAQTPARRVRERARFLGNFYTQSNKVRANSPGVHG